MQGSEMKILNNAYYMISGYFPIVVRMNCMSQCIFSPTECISSHLVQYYCGRVSTILAGEIPSRRHLHAQCRNITIVHIISEGLYKRRSTVVRINKKIITISGSRGQVTGNAYI